MITAFLICLIKLVKTEQDFSEVIQREYEKTLAGVARYNKIKNGV